MSQSVTVKTSGLYSFPNHISENPEGALVEALNVVIDRNSIIEPRRGNKQYGDSFGISTDRAEQLIVYKDRVLFHYDSKLVFDSDGAGTFSEFSGSYSDNGLRIKSIEANGNLYFTTTEGVKKISATSNTEFTTAADYITQSGGVKALDLEAVVDYATLGFLSSESAVAYRIVWGLSDANSNLILGSPSSRIAVENISTTQSGVVSLSFPIPEGVTANHFYQIYRTAVVPILTGASEEYNLVIEDFPTTAELTAEEVTGLIDVTSDSFRESGALLYINQVSGDGVEQSNEAPPFCKDISLYKGYTFFSNTSTVHRLYVDQLSIVDINDGDEIYISDGTTTRTYTFTGTTTTSVMDFSGLGTNPVIAGAGGENLLLYSANDERFYSVWFNDTSVGSTEPSASGSISIKIDYDSTATTPTQLADATETAISVITADFNITNDAAGKLTFVTANNGVATDIDTTGATNLVADGFSKTGYSAGTGEDDTTQKIFLPRVPSGDNGPSTSQQLDQAARSIVRVVNGDSSGIVNGYYDSTSTDIPGKMRFEQKILTGPSFHIYAQDATVAAEFNPTLGVIAVNETLISSENEVKPNRLYYSKFQQPEAVPLVNYLDIGPQDKEIQRIVALRDSLFIFKEDGIYRLSGEVDPFQVALFDNSAILHSPDSAVVLNNLVYAFSTQGIITVSDTGVSVISRPIEDKLLSITRDGFDYRAASFGVAYETDRSYLFWTVTNITDTVPTQCFRYNSFTNTWTRWNVQANCGIIEPKIDKMFLGAGDLNNIEIERKSRTRIDHADRQYDTSVIADEVDGEEVKLSSVSDTDIGDALIQTQYLTIGQFNRTLNKLDSDPGMSSDYFSTLGAVAGNSLTTKLTSLVAKLLIDDPAGGYVFSGSTVFSVMQTEYNVITDDLEASSVTTFSTFPRSFGTVDQEGVVVSLDTTNSIVTLSFAYPFISGTATIYKAIDTRTTWDSVFFQDPSLMKQVREGTFLFENNNFTTATVSYNSDLSPSFEAIEFVASGNGDWGQFIWGQQNWGGFSSEKPLRTLIPLQKQRCRYMSPRFEHKVALENYSLLGISFTFRVIGERAYR